VGVLQSRAEPGDYFPNGVPICCPNLTVKDYYEAFDIAPLKYRALLQSGKVLVTNWHRFAPESEHVEGGKLRGGEQRAGDTGFLCAAGAGRSL
jgi:hypothetical protein